MSVGQAPTENRDNIRTPKGNCMPASVEHWIKLHWICLPTYQSRESPYYIPLSKPIFSLLGLDLRYGFDMLKCMQTTKELREEVMGYGVYEYKTLHEYKWSLVPFVTALGSSYRPAMIATWPGRDSVGGRAWDTPHRPLLCMMLCRYGALGLPVVSISKNLSALIPSAVPNPVNSHYQIHNLIQSLLMSFDLFLYDRVEELNRSNLFPIPDFGEFLEGQVPRLPNRSRCKEQHPGGCSIFQIPRKSQKSNAFCDFSGHWRTSCYRLQHHHYMDLASATIVGEGNIQDSHRVFVQEVCSNWVKWKRPSKFQSQVFILFAFMRWRKDLILWNPKLCEQYLEESKFAGREHRCQNHNPGFHMCTQIFAGKKELPMRMEGTTIRQKQCTYEQDEAFGWCSNPQRLWIHPMDNRRLEVDVKNTQHVGRMQQNSKDHQTHFAPSPSLHCFLPKYSSQRKNPNQNHKPHTKYPTIQKKNLEAQ